MTSHLSARLMVGNNFTDEAEFWWRNSTHQKEKQERMIAWMGPINLYEVSQFKKIKNTHFNKFTYFPLT